MVDMAAIGALSAALRTATDLTKAFVGLRDEAMIQAKVIELQSAILSAHQCAFEAQTAQSALLDELATVKAKLSEIEGWATERNRYELVAVVPHLYAYRLSEQQKHDGEPSHMLCAACFDEGKKSILQGQHILHCQRCKARLNLGTTPPQTRGTYRSALNR